MRINRNQLDEIHNHLSKFNRILVNNKTVYFDAHTFIEYFKTVGDGLYSKCRLLYKTDRSYHSVISKIILNFNGRYINNNLSYNINHNLSANKLYKVKTIRQF